MVDRAAIRLWISGCVLMQEIQLAAMIKEEFVQADNDNDGMVSLEEWRTPAREQPRIVK